MWNDSDRFLLHELELREPLTPIRVPRGHSGLGLLVRVDDRPVGFLLEPAPAGTLFQPHELAARILAQTGQQILTERIYEHLRGPLPPSQRPTVDIAICTHNRSALVARCLESLRECGIFSEGSGASVMVIDNNPPDERTRHAVLDYPEVRYIVEPKPGLDFARNRAIESSSAELLAFLDDDVVIDRGWLQGLFAAYAENPDAAAFTGPILPMELETKAQIVFEKMGGFGRSFERVRYGSSSADSPTYPCGAGVFGAGANMTFRRSVLEELGGFDNALDTGAPLPGGGDLDIFYRVVRAGRVLVREPRLLVYHQHRREYPALRHQMWTWGLGSMAFLAKCWRTDPSQRGKIRQWARWWLSFQLSKIFVPFLRRNRKPWPWDLVLAEIAGGIVGAFGVYDRSRARTERLRRQYS